MKRGSIGVVAAIAAILFLTIFTYCGGGGGGTPAAGPVSVNTLDGSTDVPVDSTFRYTFASAVNSTTVTSSSYFMVPAAGGSAQVSREAIDPAICDPANALTATIACGSLTSCDLVPEGDLSGGNQYSVCLTTDITNLDGTSFEGFMASFTSAGSSGVIPTVPAGISVTAGDTQNSVAWDDVAQATSYNIYWNNVGSVTTSDTKIEGASSPYDHTGLTNGTIYYYAVTAQNSAGESGLSTEVSATPQISLPGVPGNLSATSGYEENTITWDDVTGADSYNLYWSTTTGVTPENGTKVEGATSPYTHDQDGGQGWLTGGTDYYYIVTAANTTGEGEASSQVSAEAGYPILKAFVTNATTGTGTGNLGGWTDAGGEVGLAAADNVCQTLAANAGLRHSEDFVAWMSDSSDDAYCRIHGGTGKKGACAGTKVTIGDAGPWQRTDGNPFAAKIDDMLTDGTGTENVVYMPLRYDENGDVVDESPLWAFTGTESDGTLNDAGGDRDCTNWTNEISVSGAASGNLQATAHTWTERTNANCDETYHLICMQTGYGSPLPSFAETGKTVFVTATTHDGLFVTLGGADQDCTAAAGAAGLSGTYKAWLSTDIVNVDAKDRVGDNKWVRVDGIEVADGIADLIDGTHNAPINQTEDGDYLINVNVWTGTQNNGIHGVNTCNDWTDNAAAPFSGRCGLANYAKDVGTTRSWTYFQSYGCDTPARIYCFEE